jgi:flagellar motor component MotA
MSANLMFLPFGKRIVAVAANDAARMELIIDGVLAIQAGSNPRIVATKLRSKMIPAGPSPPRRPRERARRPRRHPSPGATRRSTRSTRTTSAGWSATPT